jgi:hypothetical protein
VILSGTVEDQIYSDLASTGIALGGDLIRDWAGIGGGSGGGSAPAPLPFGQPPFPPPVFPPQGGGSNQPAASPKTSPWLIGGVAVAAVGVLGTLAFVVLR